MGCPVTDVIESVEVDQICVNQVLILTSHLRLFQLPPTEGHCLHKSHHLQSKQVKMKQKNISLKRFPYSGYTQEKRWNTKIRAKCHFSNS